MINLGDKKWGVKDSGLLAYKQVGSKFFNKDFDFTRSSDATYIDKNGVLQTQSLYNLIDYSQDFSQWSAGRSSLGDTTISPNGVLNATGLIANTDNNDHYISKGVFVTSGVEYTFSAFIKLGDTDKTWVRLWNTLVGYVDFNLSDGSIGTTINAIGSITNVGNNWYRCSITFTANLTSANAHRIYIMDDDNDRTFIGDNVSNYIYIYGAQLVEGTEPLDYQYTNGRVGIPRIDFSDGVGSLLLEPQTTQLVPYSEDFNQYDVVGDITIEGGYLAPDGTNTAYKVSGDGALYYAGVVAATSAKSIYAKSVSGTGTAQLLSHNGNTNNTFTLTEEWQRFELNSETSLIGSGNFYAVDFRGSGTLDEIIVWGANATNDQTYATSYIKTEGSAVTRTADVANNCGTEQDFNSEEGVLYIDGAALADDGTNRILGISNGGDFNNSILLRYSAVTNRITAQVRLSGVYQCSLDYDVLDSTEFNKIAFKYKQNDFSLWVNGTERATDTSGNVVTGLDVFDFDISTTNEFYGKVRSVKYFPTALGDSKLITLTGGDGSLYGLFNSFEARVLADGGTIESQDCIINELKELL